MEDKMLFMSQYKIGGELIGNSDSEYKPLVCIFARQEKNCARKSFLSFHPAIISWESLLKRTASHTLTISHSHRVGILWETLKITADYMGRSRQGIGLAFGFDQSRHGAVFLLKNLESK